MLTEYVQRIVDERVRRMMMEPPKPHSQVLFLLLVHERSKTGPLDTWYSLTSHGGKESKKSRNRGANKEEMHVSTNKMYHPA